ncbi:hypothetical protein MNBD_BACTEROID01-2617 [hydrothermal vent metagenome]|uniref:Uncharacterized protein n=1 Tax=hydrothermal vent metagenome TaxID=652676 RepID=A0A3B0UPZ8_9ZZZZ
MKHRLLTKYIASRISLFLLAMIFTHTFSVARNEGAISLNKKKIILRLNFYANPVNERTATIKAIERVKNSKPIAAKGVKLNIYSLHDGSSGLFQQVVTNEKGEATVLLTKQLPVDNEGLLTLVAKIEDNPEYADTEVEESVKEARIVLSTSWTDSTKSVFASLSGIEVDGSPTPAEDVDITFYVQRLFGLLPLGEEATVTTDERGLASIIFPKHIKGDKTGNVTIVAKVENDYTYGTVEARTEAKFGEPVNPQPDTSPALWTSKAPLWMSLSFYLALSAILTSLSYLFYQLYKIRKESSL